MASPPGKLTVFVSLCGLAFILSILMSGHFPRLVVSEPYVERKLSSSNNTRWIAFLKNDVGVNVQMQLIHDICAEDQLQIHCLQRGVPASGGFPYVTFAASDTAAKELELKYKEELGFIEPDMLMHIPPLERHMEATPSNERYSWGIDRIDSRDSVLDGYYDGPPNGGDGVHVYVLDTGIKTAHAEFGGRAIPTLESLDNGLVVCDPGDSSCAADVDGHGTHCAGTIGGNNFGVAKQVMLHAVKVLNDDGIGSMIAIVAAIEWVVQNGIKPAIISMSLGSSGRRQAYKTAIDIAVDAGVAVVVAAGNDNDDACDYSPAYVPKAITVASTSEQDDRSSFSNYGQCVDIFAPGSNIVSAGVNAYSATLSGTSMACPHVAGAAALLLQEYPNLGAAYVARILLDRATTGLVGDDRNTENELLYIQPAPRPTPQGYWSVTNGGGCFVDSVSGCLQSSNYPSPYSVDSGCIVRVNENAWRESNSVINVEQFSTEHEYDILTVNGIQHSGSEVNLNGVVPVGEISWVSDSSVVSEGWSLCPLGAAPDHHHWRVAFGNCVMEEASECITSPHYPTSYDNNQECIITVASEAEALSLRVVEFNSEENYDFLVVNGKQYSGHLVKESIDGVVPSGDITWITDGSTPSSGWKLCLMSEV